MEIFINSIVKGVDDILVKTNIVSTDNSVVWKTEYGDVHMVLDPQENKYNVNVFHKYWDTMLYHICHDNYMEVVNEVVSHIKRLLRTEAERNSSVYKFKQIQRQAFQLFKHKNHDYGDSFKEHGIVGVIVRMGDKLNQHLTHNSITIKEQSGHVGESIQDTLLDLMNYCNMALQLI